MRRVYFAFARRIATHIITLQISLFCLALLTFAKMVHVSSVIDNMLTTKLGNLPHFAMSALSQGEALTLIAIGAMVFAMLSIPIQIWSQMIPHTSKVRAV